MFIEWWNEVQRIIVYTDTWSKLVWMLWSTQGISYVDVIRVKTCWSVWLACCRHWLLENCGTCVFNAWLNNGQFICNSFEMWWRFCPQLVVWGKLFHKMFDRHLLVFHMISHLCEILKTQSNVLSHHESSHEMSPTCSSFSNSRGRNIAVRPA